MSTLKVNNLQDINGANNSTPEQVAKGRIKAWVEFDGASDTIRTDFGVSSITDVGTGEYEVNFDTAFADANYVVFGSCVGSTSGGFHAVITSSGSVKQTGKCPFRMRHIEDFNVEVQHVQLAFIR